MDADESGGHANTRTAAVIIVVGDHVDTELVIVIRRSRVAPVRVPELPGHSGLKEK